MRLCDACTSRAGSYLPSHISSDELTCCCQHISLQDLQIHHIFEDGPGKTLFRGSNWGRCTPAQGYVPSTRGPSGYLIKGYNDRNEPHHPYLWVWVHYLTSPLSWLLVGSSSSRIHSFTAVYAYLQHEAESRFIRIDNTGTCQSLLTQHKTKYISGISLWRIGILLPVRSWEDNQLSFVGKHRLLCRSIPAITTYVSIKPLNATIRGRSRFPAGFIIE